MQTRLQSMWEACVNILIGFTVNFIANMLILPMFGLNITAGDSFLLGIIYTLISLVRSYTIRRWFNTNINKEK